MSKTFREWEPDQSYLFPPSATDWLPDNDIVYFVLDVVREIDIQPIMKRYENGDGKGYPPFHPRMMLALLLYSYTQGVFSSRRIMHRCERDAAYRTIVKDDVPNFRTINQFRQRNLKELEEMFLVVLQLCEKAGLVSLGHVALDGTKIKANASRHKAMSYGYMKKEEIRLRKEIRDLIKQAKSTDKQEDRKYGKEFRGDEIPDELVRREDRLKKISEAKKILEHEALIAAEQEYLRRDEEDRECLGKPKKGRKRKPIQYTPSDKKQYNFTDPETAIMKSNNKGFDQSGNAQAVVDRDTQIIIAVDVTNEANDKKQLKPMLEMAQKNIGQGNKIEKISADAGYCSDENLEWLSTQSLDGYIATGRKKHSDEIPEAPRGRPPSDMSLTDKMARKLKTKKGKKIYAQRKWIVEPVFGQIKRCMGFTQFLLNGIDKMRSEWSLVCMAHNLRKLWRAS